MKLFRSCLFTTLLSLASSVFAAAPDLGLPAPPPPLPPVQTGSAQGFQTFGSGLPLPEFLKVTLGEMGHRAYILTPDAAQSTALISADLTYVKVKDPVPLVRQVLSGLGLMITEVSGVLIIDKKPDPAKAAAAAPEMYIYKPKNRSVGSLSTYFSLFPDLKFSYSSGIATRAQVPSSTTTVQPDGTVPQTTTSTGATTFSALNGDPSYLVVQGPHGSLDQLKTMLAELDTPVPEVMLKAYVFEVRDTQSKDSAVSFVANILGGRFGISAGGTVTGDAIRLTLPSISAAVQSLTADSRVKLVSSPTLRASDGTTASATIGTDTPTLGSIVSTNGSTQQSVTYQSAGVILNVSPRIFADSIQLDISQELSSFVSTDTGMSNTPTKLRRAFKSDVVAHSGEALLLGGLSEAQSTVATSKTFRILGSDTDDRSSSQLVVLLQVDRI